MNNKEMIFLAGLQKSLREFVSTDVGKAAKADLIALEKAAGGKKKLDEADKILSNAKKAYDKNVSDGKVEANRISRAAADEITATRKALSQNALEIAKETTNLADQRQMITQKDLELKNVSRALKRQEESLKGRDADLNRRETEVSVREAGASAREAEIKRFDDWRITAPA